MKNSGVASWTLTIITTSILLLCLTIAARSVWNYYHRPVFGNRFFLHERMLTYQWHFHVWKDRKGNMVQLDDRLQIVVVICPGKNTSIVGPYLPYTKDDHAELKRPDGTIITVHRTPNRYYVLEADGTNHGGTMTTQEFENFRSILTNEPPDDYRGLFESIVPKS